ncbi:MAG: hypothetical protein DRN14_07215 [Thermoplasmata archaeon]|nr:MAG: hypothetical protein DRN14_07215 [Thermoplasmata archaeon]
MNVASYLFQSPSPNAVQVGRLDPSSVSTDSGSTASAPVVNETQIEAKSFQASQVQEVTPSVKEKPLLDVYA